MQKQFPSVIGRQHIVFRSKSLASLTLARYSTAVRKFHQYLDQIDEIESPQNIQKYLIYLEARVSPSTYNLEGQAIKDYLLEKHRRDMKACFLIQECFRRCFRRQTTQRSVEEDGYMKHQDVLRLSAKLPTRWKLFVLSLYYSGARISELLNIQIKDVVSERGKATIKIRQGKMRKERTIYLPEALYREVKRFFRHPHQRYLFSNPAGQSYNRCYVSASLARHAEKCGFDLWPHKLRHSKAMFLKTERNLSADQIAKALGHKSVKTTLDNYFHGTPSAEDQGILDYHP